jgi:hypothetical protein
MAQCILPDALDSNDLKNLIEAMKKEDPTLITNPMVTFDYLTSDPRQPFFAARPNFLKSLWPKWERLVQRHQCDYDVAALVLLSAYMRNGGLYEVDLDCL